MALLADAVLIAHVGVVLFVVGGFVAIVIGRIRRWRWVDSLAFRIMHLATIAVVVLQSWLGVVCPLTTWEHALRASAGQSGYEVGFIQYWLQRALFYDLPSWVFTLAYSLFGALVVASWVVFPPRRPMSK